VSIWRKAVTMIWRGRQVSDPVVAQAFSSYAAESGVQVTAQSALSIATAFACTRLIASTAATLSLNLYERRADGGRSLAQNHPLWYFLAESPNAEQTTVDFWEWMIISLLLGGNAFALLNKIGDRVISASPLRWDHVAVNRDEQGLIYSGTDSVGQPFKVRSENMLHIRGFGGGATGGLSVLSAGKQALGLAISAERSSAQVFENGMRPSGALTFEKFLTEDQRALARDDLIRNFVGSANSGRPIILEGGTKWSPFSMSAEDSQLIETRKLSIEDVCRLFGVPPYMVGHSEKSTSQRSGLEQELNGFLKFTLNPWLTRIEKAISKQLLPPADRIRFFAEFDREGLLQADVTVQAGYLQIMTTNGLMTINEARRQRNLPPMPGGDVLRLQMQNQPIDQVAGLTEE
jgi:HK97 family phage portal protein